MRTYVAQDDTAWSLALHGGAGGRVEELEVQGEGPYEEGLARAYDAGAAVLDSGGSAADAVVATVMALEDDALFNAGRGSAVRRDGQVELDAALMTGNGRAGAVAATQWVRNPILAARHVMSDGECVLRVAVPKAELLAWGLAVEENAYFTTPGRLAQQRNVAAGIMPVQRHGTVGAVARDRSGAVAAATSTGGTVNQFRGRVGDSPVVGAGTYAKDGVVAVSCTGLGEAFLQGVVAHEIAALVQYAGLTLEDAVVRAIEEQVGGRDATGGVIAIGSGQVVLAHNSPAMFGAYRDGGLVVLT